MNSLILVIIDNNVNKILNKIRLDEWEIIDKNGNVEGYLNVDNNYELSTFIEYCMCENQYEVELESEIVISYD